MRIAIIAPLAEKVPPSKYGGIESMVYALAHGLALLGEEVVLYAVGNNKILKRSRVQNFSISSKFEKPLRNANFNERVVKELSQINKLLRDHSEHPFDIIQSNIGEIAYAALREDNSINTAVSLPPIVHTWHNQIYSDTVAIINSFKVGSKILHYNVSISNSHRFDGIDYYRTVYNGINTDDYIFNPNKSDRKYLAFLGRFSPEKGPLEAIQFSKRVKVPIILAGKVGSEDRDYFSNNILPLIDNQQVILREELNLVEKNEFLRNAIALVFPIQWEEPFGLVQIESMAVGTPVIALNRGSVNEVLDNKTAIIGDSLDELVEGYSRIHQINPGDCRSRVETLFSDKVMAENYLDMFRKICKT